MKKIAVLCIAVILLGGCGPSEFLYRDNSEQESDSAETELACTSEEASREAEEDLALLEKYFALSDDRTYEEYVIGGGTVWNNRVVHISSEKEGPCIYIAAGVHGDEECAWRSGNLLKYISIQAGDLYIISPVNRWGAYAPAKRRYVYANQDMNRSFPGKTDGSPAEIAAYYVFEDIREKKPDIVLDLHEAREVSDGWDSLGNSLICTEMNGCSDLVMELLSLSEEGELAEDRFQLFGPAPEGSLNYEVSTQLQIPVITVETYREQTQEHRISNQLAMVQFVMKYMGMYR